MYQVQELVGILPLSHRHHKMEKVNTCSSLLLSFLSAPSSDTP